VRLAAADDDQQRSRLLSLATARQDELVLTPVRHLLEMPYTAPGATWPGFNILGSVRVAGGQNLEFDVALRACGSFHWLFSFLHTRTIAG